MFLRSEIDGLEDEEADETSIAEADFKFLLRTRDIESMTSEAMEQLGKDFFGVNHKIMLSNR